MYDDIPMILEDYLNYLKTVRSLSPATVKEYYYDLRFFLRHLKLRRHYRVLRQVPFDTIDITEVTLEDLSEIAVTDLHAYLAYSERETGDSPTTRARKLSSLRSFFKYLTVVTEQLEKNPTEKLTTPKVKKRNPVYLNLDEALRLITTAANQKNKFLRLRDVAILVTFLTTGIRLSELCQMNVTSMRDHTFNVIGKGNKERVVYMSESCESAIAKYLTLRPVVKGEPALFLSTRRTRLSPRAVQHRIEHFLREAGFDTSIYSTHKLRHTAATLMYKEGVDIRTLQHILGHASVATTQIYTHIDDDLARQAIEKNPLANYGLPSDQ